MSRLPGLFLRGMTMGAADVVPGVSGGTLALITGIYEELIQSLSKMHPRLLKVWAQQGFGAFWREGNFAFLFTVFAGIVTSIVLFAKLIGWLMEHYPVPLWAFFCGLIIASVWVVLKPVKRFGMPLWVCFAVGAVIAWLLGSLPGLSGAVGSGALVFFLSGAVAICAMILPGISGSFILLLLGMYAPVLAAVRGGEMTLLLAFVAGCGIGLLSFVHLINAALKHFHDPVMGLLAGFMLGSLNKLWPWRVEVTGSLLQEKVAPAVYANATGHEPMVTGAVLALLAGLVAVLLLALIDHRLRKPADNEAA